MPELPEVETTLRGIQPFVYGKELTKVVVRRPSLRWPIPVEELHGLTGQIIHAVERRAKYILLHTKNACILLHLGMSGSLRVVDPSEPIGKHDHIDLHFSKSKVVRFNDPRRFGCCLLISGPIEEHKLLANLGPEPLTADFDGEHLFRSSRGKTQPIKSFIMDGKIVVGVGNVVINSRQK